MSAIAILSSLGTIKLNLLSFGWNFVAGLVITAALLILTGFIGNG